MKESEDLALGTKAKKESKLRNWKNKYFPERQLFLRSEGRVRFLTLGSKTQMTISAGLLSLAIWGSVSTIAFMSSDANLTLKKQEIANISAEYKNLSGDLNQLERQIEKRAENLEKRQEVLEGVVGVKASLKDPVEVKKPQPTSETTGELPTPQDTSLFNTIINSGAAHASLPNTVNNKERRARLIARLDQIELRQRNIAGQVVDNLSTELKSIDAILAKTPVKANELILKASNSIALGGPFIPDREISDWMTDQDFKVFDQIFDLTNRLDIASNALHSFPTGEPTIKYYVSSRFGSRKDPFTKKWAKHSGLDMAAWPGTMIKSTARGKIVKAGWHGAYGRMVEIDHGNGFRTRYGHMKKLHVKVGDQVELGKHIGDMGKTGRATSSHVHYEVWYDNKVRDPLLFMKAAEDVLKIQQKQRTTTSSN